MLICLTKSILRLTNDLVVGESDFTFWSKSLLYLKESISRCLNLWIIFSKLPFVFGLYTLIWLYLWVNYCSIFLWSSSLRFFKRSDFKTCDFFVGIAIYSVGSIESGYGETMTDLSVKVFKSISTFKFFFMGDITSTPLGSSGVRSSSSSSSSVFFAFMGCCTSDFYFFLANWRSFDGFLRKFS